MKNATTSVSLEPRPSSPLDLRPSGRGPGKTSILFRVVPHYSGNISHSNYLTMSAVFKFVFDSQNVEVRARRRLSLSRYKHKANPSLGLVDASTWSKKAQKKGRRLFGSEIVGSLAPEIYSPLWTKCFSFLFFLFPFFFWSHILIPVGENTSPLPCGSNTSSAQGASGKRGPDLLALFERRDCIFSQNDASAPKGVPCRRHALFVIMATKLSKPSRRSFPCNGWSGRLPQPGKAKSLLCKTWQTYRQY